MSRYNNITHCLDDYEKLRARVYRRLVSDVELLSDGLEALNRGKVHVTADFLDRVIESLNKEIKKLGDDNG